MDTRGVINSLFGVPRALVGVVHTGGLPGTPAGDRSIAEIVETAVAEDEGIIESSAGELLRYRRAIGADHIRVFADVKKKHAAHALTADVTLVETAKAAEFFLVDGVIVSGIATGQPADVSEVRSVAAAVGVPTLVGSGVSLKNLHDYNDADALIVGSSIKHGGVWSGSIDESRARELARAFSSTSRLVSD